MSQNMGDQGHAQASQLLAEARARLPWLRRIGVLPGACPVNRQTWQEVFASQRVTAIWPEACEDTVELVVTAHRLVELGSEVLVARREDAARLSQAGILAPLFVVD